MWDGGFNQNLLASYQSAWRRLEALLEQQATERHHFVIIIPVADSPIHLRDCLASLLELCRAYGYGGQDEHGRWRKVCVLLADDSSDAGAIEQQRVIAAEFDAAGLSTQYFGLSEQLALMDSLSGIDLTGIVGEHERSAYGHKGQAMMRNIAYLKCAEVKEKQLSEEHLLFYTLDADQEFKVKVATPEGGREVCAVNFLYHLDAIFSHAEVDVLTGKVVGDPPVSPAVMAGNFLEDVIGFLHEMATAEPEQPYRQPGKTSGGDAAYHDMADLFGFKQADSAYRYRCALPGMPSNADCFADFSTRLNRFFHGEHPTRITWFEYAEAVASVQPARTVYTGNYVFRPEALGWFIPYAPLRLRMSGPTMGRLLQAELGARFVSANLPMLHKRTLEATGQSEFRPGVLAACRTLESSAANRPQRPIFHRILAPWNNHAAANPAKNGLAGADFRYRRPSPDRLQDAVERPVIDLCGEFERQFHGDVMLFSMQRLTALGYPAATLAVGTVEATLGAMQQEMRETYRAKQSAILDRLARLKSLLHDPACGWNQGADLAPACARFADFAANIEHNFGTASPCYARIDDLARCEDWRTRQAAAILDLHANRLRWAQALAVLQATPA